MERGARSLGISSTMVMGLEAPKGVSEVRGGVCGV